MEKIASLQNAQVKKWMKLHQKKGRDEAGRFLVEGEHLIGEALAAGCVEAIITDITCPFAFRKIIEVETPVMNKLTGNVSGAHLIAVCRREEPSAENFHRILMLDGVQDPGNLGTLIRTAVSFSFDVVYCSEDTCDLYNEKAIRSTQGALFHIPVIRGSLPEITRELQRQGVQVIATSLDESKCMQELPPQDKMAFVFGNEGQGVTKEMQKLADERLRIEMHGFESLNVAVAGGIVMYSYRGE